MPNTTETPTCAVCGLNPGEIWHSGIGPTSYACCKTCIDQGAESIGVVCLRIFLDGGPASVEKNDWGSDWSHVVKTYYEGRYIGWQDILTVYPEFEAQFKKN